MLDPSARKERFVNETLFASEYPGRNAPAVGSQDKLRTTTFQAVLWLPPMTDSNITIVDGYQQSLALLEELLGSVYPRWRQQVF